MENTVPVFPLQLIFLGMIVGVKWWVCRKAPIFDSEALTQNMYVYASFYSVSHRAVTILDFHYTINMAFKKFRIITLS